MKIAIPLQLFGPVLAVAGLVACGCGWARAQAPATGAAAATAVSVPGSIVAPPAPSTGQGAAQGAGKPANKEVIGATLTLHPQSQVEAVAHGLNPVAAISAKDGSLKLVGVVPGTYTACVQVPNDALLDPCDWAPGTTAFSLQAGKAPGRLDIELVRGSTVSIRIADPNGIVPTPFQTKATGMLRVGVYSADGFFHPGRYASTDRKTHTYEINIPFDTDLKLWVETIGIQVSDAKGKRVDRTPGIVVRANTGASQVELDYVAAVK